MTWSHRSRVLILCALVALGLSLTAAPVGAEGPMGGAANRPSAAESVQRETPIESFTAEPTRDEQVDGLTMMAVAYMVIWAVIMLFLVLQWRHLWRLERDVDRLAHSWTSAEPAGDEVGDEEAISVPSGR